MKNNVNSSLKLPFSLFGIQGQSEYIRKFNKDGDPWRT